MDQSMDNQEKRSARMFRYLQGIEANHLLPLLQFFFEPLSLAELEALELGTATAADFLSVARMASAADLASAEALPSAAACVYAAALESVADSARMLALEKIEETQKRRHAPLERQAVEWQGGPMAGMGLQRRHEPTFELQLLLEQVYITAYRMYSSFCSPCKVLIAASQHKNGDQTQCTVSKRTRLIE